VTTITAALNVLDAGMEGSIRVNRFDGEPPRFTVRFTAFSEEGGAQSPRPVEEDEALKRLLSDEVGIDPGHVDQIIQRLREEGAVTIPNVHLTSA